MCSTMWVFAKSIRQLRLSRSPLSSGRHNSHLSRLLSTTVGFTKLIPEEGFLSVHTKDQSELSSLKGVLTEIHHATHRLDKKQRLTREGMDTIDLVVKRLMETKDGYVQSVVKQYVSDWGKDAFDNILKATLLYWWLRTDGSLLSFCLEDTDIRDLTVAHIRDIFKGSHDDTSAAMAVYLRVWDEPTKEVNDRWGGIEMKLSRGVGKALVESLCQRKLHRICLVCVGEVTRQTVRERSNTRFGEGLGSQRQRLAPDALEESDESARAPN
jgi:hypothetical protein